MIKQKVASAVAAALERARQDGELILDGSPSISLEIPRSRAHGDWATNIALTLPREDGQTPAQAAAILVRYLAVGDGLIEKAEVAGPGFINLTLHRDWRADVLKAIHAEGERFGTSDEGSGKRVLVEFVSTNPNGPITVAGGRNAALGDVIASLLSAVGYHVTREYYINDALNSQQMINFGKSVFHRYRQLLGHPEGGVPDGAEEVDWLYEGDYVIDIAREIVEARGREFEGLDIDDPQTVRIFRELAQDGMLTQQKADLEAFGVTFDNWFSEADLYADGRVQAAIAMLTDAGYTYEKDEAIWLRSTDFGDDKDRVLVRANGAATYIAGDAAYHKDKFDRGFDLAVDIWGADHAGYIARTKAAVAELGYDASRLEVVLYQLVRIMKDGEFVKSSKRHGDVLELKSDLIEEIGKDAARFFYLLRSANTELDIDLDLAKKTERDNPVYYVQYAHARTVQALEKASPMIGDEGAADFDRLSLDAEVELVRNLSEYPSEVALAAAERAPHRIVQYLRDLASVFHAYYDLGNRDADLRINCADPETRKARLALTDATRIVLRNGLTLLGVTAPERM